MRDLGHLSQFQPLPEACRVITLSFQRYRVEVGRVRYPCPRSKRWAGATRVPQPHYEARVVRGGFLNGAGRWQGGDECAGPGWDDVFGRTPTEAVGKARVLARGWVRWQRSLAGGAA